MNKRKALTQKTRFEVFKRDKFTCQYCGRIAPDVILEVDHIIPVAKGGQNDILNLLTSCKQCNAGKKHRELSDDSVLSKQKKQLDDLEERRNQISMMVKWRNELDKQDNELVINLAARIEKCYENKYSINSAGKSDILKWLKTFTYNELCDAIITSAKQYLVKRNGEYVRASVSKFFEYIPRVANFTKISKENPQIKDVYYIRKIVKNRMRYCDEHKAKHLIELAFSDGYDINTIKKIACTASDYNDWVNKMNELIEVDNGS